MNAHGHELQDVLRSGETLTIKFKSARTPLSNRELVAAVVVLPNIERGTFKRVDVVDFC